MAYKEKPFRKPRQVGANVENIQRTGHRKDYSRQFKEMERWMDKNVTGEAKTNDVDKRAMLEETTPPPIVLLSERELISEQHSNRIFPDIEEGGKDDEEETQLQIAEIYVPSTDEDDVPIVQTLRAEVCPPHKIIPKDDRALGQKVAKNFDAGLFEGTVTNIEKRRGRSLYHVIYDDGDCEDMDEIEYEDAWFLFIKTQNSDTPFPVQDNTESEMTCSDMEGSVYNNSDKDVTSEDEDRPQSSSPSPRQNGHKRKRMIRKVSK